MPERVLVVGGTGFVGAWTTRAAAAGGRQVSVLTRGRTKAALPESVHHIHADRDGDLSALEGMSFDVVIDGAGYVPAQIDRLLDTLKGRLGHYVFVSSISAIDLSSPPVLESQPGVDAKNPDKPDYGEAKAQCERRVLDRLGDRASIVRPGLISGPGDHTDRATWWATRAARGGDAVAPGSPADELQLIDARDVANFVVRVGVEGRTGTFHAVGQAMRWDRYLSGIATGTGDKVRWHWASAELLDEHGAKAWVDLPAWMPAVGPYAGTAAVDRTLALRAGMATRDPVVSTLGAWRWRKAHPRPEDKGPGPGLDPQREAAILAALGV